MDGCEVRFAPRLGNHGGNHCLLVFALGKRNIFWVLLGGAKWNSSIHSAQADPLGSLLKRAVGSRFETERFGGTSLWPKVVPGFHALPQFFSGTNCVSLFLGGPTKNGLPKKWFPFSPDGQRPTFHGFPSLVVRWGRFCWLNSRGCDRSSCFSRDFSVLEKERKKERPSVLGCLHLHKPQI